MPATNPPWSSREAFDSILPALGKLQQAALNALLSYHSALRRAPTAWELERFGGVTYRKYARRLTELRKVRAVHWGPEKRTCSVSGKTVNVWCLGPGPGQLLSSAEEASTLLKEKVRDVQLEQLLAAARPFSDAVEQSQTGEQRGPLGDVPSITDWMRLWEAVREVDQYHNP